MDMNRRHFLVALASASAAGVLGACAEVTDANPPATRPGSAPGAPGSTGSVPATAAPTTPPTAPATTAPLEPFTRPDGVGPWVLVLGGGVAGMSAAHELRTRGLPVTVLEKRSIPGGKARSIDVPHSGSGGRRDLPGEHGFRFFPGFYRHLPDTMKRIPYQSNPGGVFDNLVAAPATTMARAGLPDITLPLMKLDLTLDNVSTVFGGVMTKLFGLTPDESGFFTGQMARFLTSCDQRRFAVYEQQDWWRFVGADRFSENYRKLLAIGITRNTVASRAEDASARTIGLVIARFVDQLGAGNKLDRLLNGPTNDVWLRPWLDHLRSSGVDYRLDVSIAGLRTGSSGIEGVVVDRGAGSEVIQADEYVLALPVEGALGVLPPELVAKAPELGNLASLKTEWMNGIQFFLSEPAPLVAGHVNYVDSPWALTSVSQQQFWPSFSLPRDFGDGTVQDVLSVDISNWNAKGILYDQPATACTADQIAEEVWAQIKAHIDDVDSALPDHVRSSWVLDPGITFPTPGQASNDEPLLVNTAGSWFNRPDAATSVPNLYLASDYVRTTTDLATMEGANEAARRAVNAILVKHHIGSSLCELFELEEPPYLKELRDLDKDRFAKGQAHIMDAPPGK